MCDVVDIARYFIWLANGEPEPELLTAMRLQKLLYYAQGWSLAVRGRRLFDSVFEAWAHGPVSRKAYPLLAKYPQGRAIDPTDGHDGSGLSLEDRDFVRSIWESYKKYSAIELRAMTHRERPWLEARGDLPPDAASDRAISDETMRQFFRDEYSRQALPGLELEVLEEAAREFEAGRGIPLSAVRQRLANRVRD